jgi:hypothetical protein
VNSPFQIGVALFLFPTQLSRFTSQYPVDVTIAGYGNPYFLPSLAQLWRLQAGYRYNPNTGQYLDGWKNNWLVVGDEGGDPFIFDSDSGRVLFAIHGQGTWDTEELFPDLKCMAGCLASIGGVVEKAGLELTDERSYIKQEYVEELETHLEKILDSNEAAQLVVLMLGWKQVDFPIDKTPDDQDS